METHTEEDYLNPRTKTGHTAGAYPSVDSEVEEGKENTLLRSLVDAEEALAPEISKWGQIHQLTLLY